VAHSQHLEESDSTTFTITGGKPPVGIGGTGCLPAHIPTGAAT